MSDPAQLSKTQLSEPQLSKTQLPTKTSEETSGESDAMQNENDRLRNQLSESQNEIDRLKRQLSEVTDQSNALNLENGRLRKSVVHLQTVAEQEEEAISNKLLKRIDELKAEKQRLMHQVEFEEEYLTNTLQKQLEQARKEKTMLETSMEREQENVVNKLRREISKLTLTRERSFSDPSELKVVKELKEKLAEAEAQTKAAKQALGAEQEKNAALLVQVDTLKAATLEIQTTAEQQEEFISNRLLRRIQGLKKEKELLIQQVETEEEYITNSLNKRVAKLLEEKQQLEAALQAGQSHMVDHLQKRLDIVRTAYVPPKNVTDPQLLREALTKLEEAHHELEIQLFAANQQVRTLQQQIQEVKNENLLMKQRHQWELEKLSSIEHDRAKLEQDLELTEERQFNLLTEPFNENRSRSHSIPSEYRRKSSGSGQNIPSPPSPTASPTLLPNSPPGHWWARRSSRPSTDEAGF